MGTGQAHEAQLLGQRPQWFLRLSWGDSLGAWSLVKSTELGVGSPLLASQVRAILGSVPSEGPRKGKEWGHPGEAALLLDGGAGLR